MKNKVLLSAMTAVAIVLCACSAPRPNNPQAAFEYWAQGYDMEDGENDAEKVTLLTKAADMGNTQAMNKLAEIYFEGSNGVKQSDKKAFNYLQQSARAGDWFAYGNLGIFYRYGIGTKKDYNAAFDWYAKALKEKGDIFSCCINIILMQKHFYLTGNEAEQEEFVREFNVYFDKFLKQNEGTAINAKVIGDMFFSDEFRLKEELNNSQKIKWYSKFLETNTDAETQYRLALAYRYSTKIKDYKEKTIELYTKSAEQEHAWAQAALGDIYLRGEIAPRDYEKAFSFHLSAAQQGITPSRQAVAKMYREGIGVSQNTEEAQKWEAYDSAPQNSKNKTTAPIMDPSPMPETNLFY